MYIQETAGDRQQGLHTESFKWENRLAAVNGIGWLTLAVE